MILLPDHAAGSVIVNVGDGAMIVTLADPVPGGAAGPTFDTTLITFDTTSHTFDEAA